MASNSLSEDFIENIGIQLQEIEMLQAMFPGEKEIVWHDPTLLLDAEEFINSNGKTKFRYLTFDLNLHANFCKEKENAVCKVQASITLPETYPQDGPTVCVTSNELTRNEQSLLNQDLQSYISTLDRGEMMILDVISWLQTNTDKFYKTCRHGDIKGNSKSDLIEDEEKELSLMWLYMHHIYNKEKRKNIIHWADELSLTGFSLPGKPGVVYVEGPTKNAEDYFERLRRLSWKRMSCKLKETCPKRTFSNFEELSFDAHGGRDYHMDMGKFFVFLKEHNLSYMFKELFGVDGHEAK